MLDPTVPEVRQKVADDIARVRQWGFELIKHDYTTFDIFGRWGFQMGAAMTRDGWTFAAGPSRTTAEVINDLYRSDSNRRRRRARHRLQHGEPSLGRRLRDLSHRRRHERHRVVAHAEDGREHARVSRRAARRVLRGRRGLRRRHERGAVGAESPVARSARRAAGRCCSSRSRPDALGAEQRRDLTAALALAAAPQPLGEPLDWQRTVYPTRWRLEGREIAYDWVGADGAGPP